MIAEMETTRKLPEKTRLSLNFIEVVKSMGYNISIEHNQQDYSNLDERDMQHLNAIIGKDIDDNEDNGESSQD